MGDPSLATKTVRGVIWSGGGIAIQMVVTLLFFHVLDLKDMGYFTWAQRIVVLVPLFSALGLNDALVRHQDAAESHFSSAFWMCLIFGCVLYVLSLFCGRLLGVAVAVWAQDVDANAFANVLIPLALMIPPASVSGIFRARLARDLNFLSIAFSEIISTLIAAVVGLGLLAGGYGIESAIWNAIVREVFLLISLWVSTAWWPSLIFRWSALREILGFGLNVAGSNIVNYVNNNLDKVFFIPIYLGPVSTALYSFAYQYTMVPLSRGSQILTRVIFPAFSKVQDDSEALGRGYLRTIAMIALLAWPILASGFIYAPEVLLLVKGEEMLTALTPLRLLIVAGMIKAVGTVVGSIFLAKGKADWSFRWTLANLIVFVPALFWGVQYGIDGVAAVLSGIVVIFLIVTQGLVNRLIGLRVGPYLGSLVRPVLVTVVVTLVLVGVRGMSDLGVIETLIVGGLVGSIVYAVAVRLFAWAFVMQFWRDVRG